MVLCVVEGKGLHHGRVGLPEKTGKAPNRCRVGSGRIRPSSRPTSGGRLRGTLGSLIVRRVRRNNPLLMHMSPFKREWSNTLNERLNEWSMREGPLVLEASKMDFMPQKMRNIDLLFVRLI